MYHGEEMVLNDGRKTWDGCVKPRTGNLRVSRCLDEMPVCSLLYYCVCV